MLEDMQLRNFARATQRQYIHYVADFAKYFQLSPGPPRSGRHAAILLH